MEGVIMNKKLKTKPSAWLIHCEMIRRLVRELDPDVIVELGTHWGHSFFSMVEGAGKDCECIAVDTWEGDVMAGEYGSEVYDFVKDVRDDYSDKDIKLWKTTFNEAARRFERTGLLIDILHIDGLHTYNAVRHDYDTWKDYVAGNGVIMFHDIGVRMTGFGVYQLWEALKRFHPDWYFIEDMRGAGLGIMTKSKLVYTQIDNLFKEG